MTVPDDIRPILRPTLTFRSQQDSSERNPSDETNGSEASVGNPGSPYAVSNTASMPGDDSANRESHWSADEVAIGGLTQAVRDIENKSTGGFAKVMVLLVSLGIFVGAGMAWWSPRMIGMLVVILLFHEAGHYIAMRGFGYRNVKMFFIPFLGAAVSGQHFNIAAWKKAIVYLAGPVPGILAAIPLMWFGSTQGMNWMFELGGMSLVLNALNLLPVMPLDGGWIMHLTVFSRSPVLELLSRLMGIVLMLALAFFAESKFLIFIVIPLVLSLPVTFRVSKLIRRLRGEPLPQPDRDEIPDGAIRMLSDEIQSTPLAATPKPQKAALLVQIYEALIVRPPGIVATLSIWFLYFGSFAVAVVGGSTMYAMRGFFAGGMFDEGLFNPTSHHLVLDVDDTEFHLGKETVESTLLAVARFDSVGELNGSLEAINASDRESYTHVRIGNVLLASVPGKSRKQLAMEGSEDALIDDESFEEDFDFDAVRSRMEDMMRPVDPTKTWLSPLIRPTKEEPTKDEEPTNDKEFLGETPRRGRPMVDVISGMHDSIQISCRAPDATIAKQTVETDFQMLGITDEHLYIPNWSPIDPPTRQQIANRETLRILVDGISRESAPKLFELKSQLQKAQYSLYDNGNENTSSESAGIRSAKFQAKSRDLERTYTTRVLKTLDGQQAEVAKLFQQYQTAMHEYSEAQEQNAIDLVQKRATMSEEAYYDMLDQIEEAPSTYPLMDHFLVEPSNLLGFGEPGKQSYHFSAHVTGSLMTSEQFEGFVNPDQPAIPRPNSELDAGNIVLIHVHRAVDQAATVAAIIGHLQRQQFLDFRLHYMTPQR